MHRLCTGIFNRQWNIRIKTKKHPIDKPDEMVYNTDTDRESACLTDDASESFLVKK